MPRRTRSPHPGVVLIPPRGEHTTWRARYVDPDSGRKTWERLDPLVIRTVESRRAWGVQKAKTIAKRRLELEGGAPRATGGALDKAVDRFFEDRADLRPATREAYRAAADKLVAWAKKTNLKSADDLNGARLLAFRAELVKEKKTIRKDGGKRGERKTTEVARSPHSVNRELRAIGTVLGYARRLGLLPRLTLEGLKDGLQKLRVPSEPNDYLKPAELGRLLDAALRHDAETFAATRAEHAGKAAPGTTPRYEPIAPFVAAALLTGCRLNELVDLEWPRVDLDGAGEIRITSASKTHRGRIVDLAVSPALHKVLAAMKLRAGDAVSVFGLTEGQAIAAAKRLRDDYGAPAKFTWQLCRGTCGSYLTCAPSIFGASSAYRSARQLGHSVQVAERNYVGLIKNIAADARDLESAMSITEHMTRVIDSLAVPRADRAIDHADARGKLRL
ncbi:MAG TPA: hypothetical protein VHC69_12720 [Polyangiaceae bacterium]|nr:hypothetical protein [Polyangiaceae bacterium]